MKKRQVYSCQAGCPVESTLQIISGKWKSVILYHLFKQKLCHFGELHSAIADCSRRMLALQLRELEDDGIIKKTIFSEIPLRTDYTLTEFGQTLRPVVASLEQWGIQYNRKRNRSADTQCSTFVD
ncbi:winged helix-turn-helix transcriptional regulator [Liquorilactobacillus satsumensis]|uniref:winged helix-turn-helix transcriptional regulator n=1 Tax=Liquorilactobacillus satsumensis TaxID=259059 RepID=UPI0021C41D14|nr:helix-turn-helix domain-containing protein [Liquorilactobacillus satsumensis]MCP9328718.1 helix-turn-helix transcriptional regulator [Liquorilactobacillus satsumensis]